MGRGNREVPVFGMVPGVFLRIPHPKLPSGPQANLVAHPHAPLSASCAWPSSWPSAALLLFFEQEGFGAAARRLLQRCHSQLDESSRRSIELGVSLPETAG